MKRRVAVTGMGCITPVGCDATEVWENLVNARSGIGFISQFDASSFPIQIAAEVDDWTTKLEGCFPRVPTDLPRQSQFAIAAALQAWDHAGFSTERRDHHPGRTGISLGCGEIFPDLSIYSQPLSHALHGEEFQFSEFLQHYADIHSQESSQRYEPSAPLAHIAAQIGIEGPTKNYTTACASSTIAIGEAVESIRSGVTDVVLAGGAHSMIHPLGLTGFHRLSVLSQHGGDPSAAYRPFDKTRDGFVVGEGGIVLVLEEMEHAHRRSANVLAELCGYGSTHDAYRVTDVQPDGQAAARSITLALRDGGIDPSEIGYVNSHGSGTQANDIAETNALKIALGDHAYRVSISSTKSMTGHLTTACGAIETMICVLALQHGVAPPTLNYNHPDPLCDLDCVPNQAREIDCRYALNSNFGFGGNNVTLLLSKPSG